MSGSVQKNTSVLKAWVVVDKCLVHEILQTEINIKMFQYLSITANYTLTHISRYNEQSIVLKVTVKSFHNGYSMLRSHEGHNVWRSTGDKKTCSGVAIGADVERVVQRENRHVMY